MINQTKHILEESLKKLMLEKPLDKITIRDLTEDCGISRMAFYYHFKDIYDLVNGPAWKMQPALLPAKKLTTPGLKDWYRFLMLCMKISHLY